MASRDDERTVPPARRGRTGLLRHLVYWILPALISIALVLAYFSGIEPLRDLVASPRNREFGLLEHLQAAILVATAVGGVIGFRRADNGVEKTVCALVAAGAAFIALEEMDFGLHYWEFVFGESGLSTLNIHNQGENLEIIKPGSDTLIVSLFLIFPIAAWRISDPRIRYFVPDPLIGMCVLVGFAVSLLAHSLNDAGLYPAGPLTGNLSEFRETFTYYALMLYGLDLALRRNWAAQARKSAT
jgi:hypothetical protein